GSFEELQRHLAWWMVAVADQRVHGTTRERPAVRFERGERRALRPVPSRPLAVRTRRLKRRVSTDCFVDIDTVRYSAPRRHGRETVEGVLEGGRVELSLRGAGIARPPRWAAPSALVRPPAHSEGLFRREAPAPAPPPAVGPADPGARPLSIYAELVEGG